MYLVDGQWCGGRLHLNDEPSLRSYLLWLRINVAIEAAIAGASWTQAAHKAGFADSAHLSRTHKRMFGIEPTAIRHT